MEIISIITVIDQGCRANHQLLFEANTCTFDIVVNTNDFLSIEGVYFSIGGGCFCSADELSVARGGLFQ